MTIDEAIEVLELHNQWRKGAEIPMETPVRIGMAIDLVVCELKNLRIAHVMQSVCDYCTAYPFDERGKTPLCKTCKDNPLQTVL
jgi:hypothetical protein